MSTAWQWRCSSCGHTGPARGVFRIGTSGTTRTIGLCTKCSRWRLLILEKAGTPAPTGATAGPAGGASEHSDSDKTWYELTAYVSEGSMSAEIAEQIANSSAAEDRKREVAAHIAGGALKAEDALRLLQIR